MTVSPTHIWKSASQSLRQPAHMRDRNMSIGGTLRDLYLGDAPPSTEGEFRNLLDRLEASEKSR